MGFCFFIVLAGKQYYVRYGVLLRLPYIGLPGQCNISNVQYTVVYAQCVDIPYSCVKFVLVRVFVFCTVSEEGKGFFLFGGFKYLLNNPKRVREYNFKPNCTF